MKNHPLDAWRKKAGLTQAQLGERLGMTQSGISLVMRGKRRIPREAAVKAFVVCGGEIDLATIILGHRP